MTVPARRHVSRIGRGGGISAVEFGVEKLHERVNLLGRTGHVGRRHLTRLQFRQHELPEIAILGERLDGEGARQIETGFELTGPIARGDWATVDRHLEAIRERAPELEPMYRTLADATAALV